MEMEIGLESMTELIERVSNEQSVCSPFFENFYVTIIQDTLELMTDYFHLSGFKL